MFCYLILKDIYFQTTCLIIKHSTLKHSDSVPVFYQTKNTVREIIEPTRSRKKLVSKDANYKNLGESFKVMNIKHCMGILCSQREGYPFRVMNGLQTIS